jgi:hypothetical protein
MHPVTCVDMKAEKGSEEGDEASATWAIWSMSTRGEAACLLRLNSGEMRSLFSFNFLAEMWTAGRVLAGLIEGPEWMSPLHSDDQQDKQSRLGVSTRRLLVSSQEALLFVCFSCPVCLCLCLCLSLCKKSLAMVVLSINFCCKSACVSRG